MSDGPVNIDFAPLDVFQDAIVRGRFATLVVVLGKTIDGDGYFQAAQPHPFLGNGYDGAGYDHGVHPHVAENWQDAAQFAVPNEGFAANHGNVQWTMLPD